MFEERKVKLIDRDYYLEKLINVRGTLDIKIITGVRRSGKSKLLERFKRYLIENVSNANIIHINFNLTENEYLMEYHRLYDEINSLYDPNKENYVLIDEVQMCEGFEKAINSLHASEKFDIYITGSNAFLLSSDLATLFTGRAFEIKIFPFSFKEYITYFNFSDKYKAFDNYMMEGGMSGSYLYENIENKYDYINGVWNALIVRDIRRKNKIQYPILLDRIADFLMDNISSLTSIRNMTDILNKDGNKVSHNTVNKYVKYLCNAYAFYKVQRYDIKGKKYLESNDKYYLSDHAFRYARLGIRNLDYGRILENIVAIELLRRGYEVYVGVLRQKEIDFVAIKRSEKIYIQVSNSIDDKDTFKREVTPLLKIEDNYPKIIISRTRQNEYTYEGIRVIDITDFLLNDQK